MIRWLWRLLWPVVEEPPRPEGQACASCEYFIDYTDTEPADECNGYCSWALYHDKSNEYGGHWTHDQEWCRHWSPAPRSEKG